MSLKDLMTGALARELHGRVEDTAELHEGDFPLIKSTRKAAANITEEVIVQLENEDLLRRAGFTS
jgi:hypothetical protein